VLEYVWGFPHGEAEFVTVVVPELFRKPSVSAVVRPRTFALKRGLLREPGVVVADVPKLAASADGGDWVEPRRAVAVVPVAAVQVVSLRALVYAQSLGLDDTRVVHFSFDEDETPRIERDWQRLGLGTPLEVVDAPFRDLGPPLLARIRQITAEPDTVAVVVMPELVVRGTDRLLHNHRALYVKRLLLFEPRVIVTSVPYQLV
jgi:hypothetical protein